MVPLNFVSSILSRPQLLRRLTRSISTSGESFSCGCKPTREECPPKKCESKVTKARRRCKPMQSLQTSKDEKFKSPPEFCSKTALEEFKWKMQALQKQWDTISAQLEKDCEGRGYKDKEGSAKPKSECKVKPPKAEEEGEGPSLTTIILSLVAVAVVAAIAYMAYQEYEKKKEGGEGGAGGEGGDDKKDGKKDDKKEKGSDEAGK